MSSASTSIQERRETIIHAIGRLVLSLVISLGDLALFGMQMGRWLFTRPPRRSVMLQAMHDIGVRSISVIVITGTFLGMVLAVQTYDQFRVMRLETRLGAVINITLVQELGPVLAATMLAGRVGGSMAAELGTMRVTEQIEALRALGANPIHYLVVPRFLACVFLIPLLTAIADAVGIFSGWLFSTQVLGINSFHYWQHAESYVTAYDVFCGLFKSVLFGAAIALISCHRGFSCGAGAEGVGKAATEAFVFSFVAILALDFFLGMVLVPLYYILWPGAVSLL